VNAVRNGTLDRLRDINTTERTTVEYAVGMITAGRQEVMLDSALRRRETEMLMK
jgi:hypothetical protein